MRKTWMRVRRADKLAAKGRSWLWLTQARPNSRRAGACSRRVTKSMTDKIEKI